MAANESAFLYSEDELNELGVLDEGESRYLRPEPSDFVYVVLTIFHLGAPQLAKRALDLMRRRPDLLTPNKWALQCVMALSLEKKTSSASYNGEDECPQLIYRSKPTAQSQHVINSNSIYGADDTPLGKIWPTVLDDIRLVIKTAVPNYSCLNECRHGPNSFTDNPDAGSLGPAVVCVGVPPGSISADTAHDVSQTILELLLKHGVDNAVVEWREAVVSRLSG